MQIQVVDGNLTASVVLTAGQAIRVCTMATPAGTPLTGVYVTTTAAGAPASSVVEKTVVAGHGSWSTAIPGLFMGCVLLWQCWSYGYRSRLSRVRHRYAVSTAT